MILCSGDYQVHGTKIHDLVTNHFTGPNRLYITRDPYSPSSAGPLGSGLLQFWGYTDCLP